MTTNTHSDADPDSRATARACEIVEQANKAGIRGQQAFLQWAHAQGIECCDYDEDGIMLFISIDGDQIINILLFDGSEWVLTHL